MKVSIITVVYNNEKTIESAINSVLSQTYNDIEYIIIDGGSQDSTTTIIQRYLPQISLFISEPDNGIYDAMNKGIKLATGDVIGILNSDDLYNDANVIEDVINEFSKNEKLNVIYGDLVYVNAENTNKIVRKWVSKSFSTSFFKYGNVPPHPTLFVKKHIYAECGLFNVNYKLAADYDLMLRIFNKFGASSKYLPKLMIRMRLGGATNKSWQNIINGNKEILNSWKNNGLKAPWLLMPCRLFKRLSQFV